MRGNITNIVRGDLCLQCGICASICPKSGITIQRDKNQNYVPVVDEQCCTRCGLCVKVCPGIGINFESLIRQYDHKGQREKHPLVGEYIEAFIGYSREKGVREIASSGGVVPTILSYLIEARRIDGALVVTNKEGDPFNPEVFIGKTQQEILGSVQSKYHPVCLNSALEEIGSVDGEYAVVGLPCHIHGLRKYEKLKDLEKNVFLTLGLFCGLNLRFDSLEFFAHKVGKGIDDLREVSYREGNWPGKTVLQFAGATSRIIDKNIANHIFTLPRCLYCVDHTNELADISCGDAWLPELLRKNDAGWSAIICRSPKGVEILDELRDKGRLFLEKVDIERVIESQYPMLCFKKKTAWLRIEIGKIAGGKVPNYDREHLQKTFSLLYLIGNIILILNIYLMKSDKFKNFVKRMPIKVLKVYEILILRLLYRDNSLRMIIRRTINIARAKSAYFPLSKIVHICASSKKRYGTVGVILVPGILLYKIIRKLFLFSKYIFEYGIYRFEKNKHYDISYLEKATGLRDKNELFMKLKEKRSPFIDNIDISSFEKYNEFFPDGRKNIMGQAKLVSDHIFDLLGSGPRKLSPEGNSYQPIDWQLDFKSGYRWNPKSFFRSIRYGQIEGADIIVPWEHSRFQDRIAIAQAYVLTNDVKFAIEFQNQVNDWIENNKCGFGVNWVTAMDAAIRAANWIVVKELFETGFDFSESFLVKFYGSLYDHGRYIRKHLLHSNGITTNHYISGLAGLLSIALYCPFFKKSKEWLDFAVKELENEIKKQVYPDGCDYEASTSYHLLVLEIFFYSLLLCEKAGIHLSEAYRAKVKKMFEVSLYYLKPNGMAPQVGDNDSGRFFKFTKRQILDHRYLVTLAAVYYKDSDFKLKYSEFSEEAFWLFGHDRKIIWDKLPHRTSALTSKSFPEAGWFTIRHNNDYCFISCGLNGQGGNGGHAHNDKLSFELMLDGQDVIVDPGTYVYTAYPKERNKFRSTEYHNTITFGGCEQNEISANAIFSLPDRVKIANVVLTETNNNITFQGEIRYLNLTHKRVISLDKEICNWQIIDWISSGKKIDAKLTFHLSPDVFFDNGFIYSKRTKKRIASIEIPGHILEKSEYDYSPEYGVKLRAESLVAAISTANDVKTINTYIYKT